MLPAPPYRYPKLETYLGVGGGGTACCGSDDPGECKYRLSDSEGSRLSPNLGDPEATPTPEVTPAGNPGALGDDDVDGAPGTNVCCRGNDDDG